MQLQLHKYSLAHFLIQRPIPLTTALPEDLHERLTEHLKVGGRLPKGAYQRFIVARIEEYFKDYEMKQILKRRYEVKIDV